MDARFAALRAHPDFARAMQDLERFADAQPSRRRRTPRLALGVFAFVLAAALVGRGMQHDDPMTSTVGGLLAILGLWNFLRAKRLDARPRPVVGAAPAVVVERYTEQVDTGRDSGKLRDLHYARLRDEEERQQSYRVSPELYERLEVGWIGIAYPREKVLLDYRRFEL